MSRIEVIINVTFEAACWSLHVQIYKSHMDNCAHIHSCLHESSSAKWLSFLLRYSTVKSYSSQSNRIHVSNK